MMNIAVLAVAGVVSGFGTVYGLFRLKLWKPVPQHHTKTSVALRRTFSDDSTVEDKVEWFKELVTDGPMTIEMSKGYNDIRYQEIGLIVVSGIAMVASLVFMALGSVGR